MDKNVTPNPKKESKNKKKKKQPLKVVYITNPMKFNATASEFRALVQKLTGQDADVSDFSRFSCAPAKVEEPNVHAAAEVGHCSGGPAPEKGSDLMSYKDDEGDVCRTPEMIDNFEDFSAAYTLWNS